MPGEPNGTEYRLLVEHSPVMVWRAGLDAKCNYFNDTWLAFTGRTMQQEIGDGWADGVHADDLRRCVDHYLDHFKRREPFEMEYRLRRHDGVFRWIFDRGVPYTADGRFAGFVGSCVDVDDRRRGQEARERQGEEQLALAREFEQWILTIVSHEIRNPLAAIVSYAKILRMEARRDEQTRTIAERISGSADRIANIIHDLFDLSRERNGGGIPIEPTETDLHTLCREVAGELATSAPDRRIDVACEGDSRGVWDPNRIAQALSNLIGNAVKHGAPGTPVGVSIRSDDSHVVVEVHNAGAIPADVIPTLFQPFAVRASRRREGLGLGLFIARAIAHAHRGELQVASTAEAGTTFRLVLPRVTGTSGT